MFMLRECAACMMMVLLFAMTVLALYVIGYLLKATGAKLVKVVRTNPDGVHPVRVAALTILLAIAFLIPAAATHAQQAVPSSDAGTRYTVSVTTSEVLLRATVRNHKGTPVAGLGKDNFQLFEDGALQSIKYFSHEDVPVTVGLVIDNSGSMRPKRADVVAAVLAFVKSSNPEDQMFLVNFNERVSFGLPSNLPFTDKPEQLQAAMSTVIPDGRTALYDAVATALDHLKRGSHDKKVLIVVSDGADNASAHSKAQILNMAAQSGAIVYAVGIYEPDDPDVSPHVLSELTKASGGEAFFPESLHAVLPTCERIAHAIRNQYTLSYISTNQRQDGSYRAIQVHAAAPDAGKLVVITRAGYAAPLPAAAARIPPAAARK